MPFTIVRPTGARHTIVNFSPEEFEHVEGMDQELLLALDSLRVRIGRPIHINESNPQWFSGTAHKKTSLHYEGKAVDIHVGDMGLWEIYYEASRVLAFTGIGVYPCWNRPGLHVEHEAGAAERKLWWRDSIGQYRGIASADLVSIFLPSLADSESG